MWMILRIRFLSIGRMLLDLRPAEDLSSIQCVRLVCSTVRRLPFPATPRGQNLYRPRIPTPDGSKTNVWRGCEFGAGTTRAALRVSAEALGSNRPTIAVAF